MLKYIKNLITISGLTTSWLILSILFLSTFLSSAQSQDLIPVRMSKQVGIDIFDSVMMPTMLYTDARKINIPKQIKKGIIKYRDFNIKDSELDEPKHIRILFLIGEYKNNIVIVVDTNNNQDLSDEKIMLYPKTPKKDQDKLLSYVKLDININGKSIEFFIKPYPYLTAFKYNKNIENRYYLMLEFGEHIIGTIPGERGYIKAYNNKPSPIYSRESLSAYLEGSSEVVNFFKVGELFSSGGKKYILEDVSFLGDSLIIKEMTQHSLDNTLGYSEGLFMKAFKAKDIVGNEVNIPDYRQLTLLDFWGTWCAPCKELTPKLKSLHQKNVRKLNIISIAYDREVSKVEKYITTNKMDWTHIVESPDLKKDSIIKKFKIVSYPTFILIDHTGKIVYKGEGQSALNKLEVIIERITIE